MEPENNVPRIFFKSIRTKILFSGGLALLLVAGIIIAYAAININGIALEKAEKDLYVISQGEKATITSDLNNAIDAARTMNEILTAVKKNNIPFSREHVDSILKQVLEDNPSFVGTYAPYEPNAFDGNDSAYVNTPLSDATGRYLTYCNRDATTKEIKFEPLMQYDIPGIGNWYVTPQTTLKETLTEPIIYPVQGVDVQMTSLTIPIITDGKFQGITGVDYSLNSIDSRADAVNVYGGSARMFVISNGLKIIAMTGNNTHLGEDLTKSGYPYHKDVSDEETAIRTQKEQIVIKDGYLKIMNPVTIGRTTTPWLVELVVPMENVSAEANALASRMILLGIILIIIGLGLLWFTSSRIAEPIIKLTAVAQKIEKGDLSQEIKIHEGDEIGQLADAIGHMQSSLRAKALAASEFTKVADRISMGDLSSKIDIHTGDELDVLIEAFTRMINAFKMMVSMQEMPEEEEEK